MRINGKGGPNDKISKKRIMPMSKWVHALLEPYFALHDKWFIGERQVQKIAIRAQIAKTVTFYVLRHFFATLALQNGISWAAVKKILGHDRLATTAIYLNLTDSHVSRGISE